MEDKLYKKLEIELKYFKDKIKEKGIDYVIDRAYELTAKQELIDSIMYDHQLSKTEIKALLSRDNVLDEMYDDWLSFDGNMREHINYSVDKSLSILKSEAGHQFDPKLVSLFVKGFETGQIQMADQLIREK